MRTMIDEGDWQSRTKILLGEGGYRKIAETNVLVVGVGGVGGIAAEMLVRAGVENITIADGDAFEDSNRNRQLGALCSTVGRGKTSALADRFRDVNPDVRVTELPFFLKADDFAEILQNNHFSIVLDAIDSVESKVALIAECVRLHVPLVSCMGAGERLNPEMVRTVDISQTQYCPLARVVRKKLRDLGIVQGVTVVYSPESFTSVAGYPNAPVGTISYMPAVFGCHCAASVIRTLLSL